MNYNANPGWSQLSKVWDAMYGVIENANLVVDGINNSQLIQQAGATRTSMMRFRAGSDDIACDDLFRSDPLVR